MQCNAQYTISQTNYKTWHTFYRLCTRGVESEPESVIWRRLRLQALWYLSSRLLCNSVACLFDFCAIYFTTKTLFVHYCAPFIRIIQKFLFSHPQHTVFVTPQVLESEMESKLFSAGVRVWSPKFSVLYSTSVFSLEIQRMSLTAQPAITTDLKMWKCLADRQLHNKRTTIPSCPLHRSPHWLAPSPRRARQQILDYCK